MRAVVVIHGDQKVAKVELLKETLKKAAAPSKDKDAKSESPKPKRPDPTKPAAAKKPAAKRKPAAAKKDEEAIFLAVELESEDVPIEFLRSREIVDIEHGFENTVDRLHAGEAL